MDAELESLAKTLQASISPMALISGVGLLILSLTNRFSRVTDRLREMAAESAKAEKTNRWEEQVRIFAERAALLRWAITCSVASVLGASVLVLVLFAAAIFRIHIQLAVFALFGCSLLFLIASLILFLRDMQLSLRAINEHLKQLAEPI